MVPVCTGPLQTVLLGSCALVTAECPTPCAPVHFSLQNALRHALLCPEPTAQPVLLAFSEPEEASALFNPVEEVVRVGGVHLEQDALITHHYDYEGEPIAMYNNK